MFEKPESTSKHMKLLYVRDHLDGRPVGLMLVDGGASVNIMLLAMFQKFGQTNLSLTGFLGGANGGKGYSI
jgi:hypothetical protein